MAHDRFHRPDQRSIHTEIDRKYEANESEKQAITYHINIITEIE